MKKTFALMLVLALVVSAAPMAMAAEPFVAFTPWAETSTPEDLAEVAAAIDAEIEDIGITMNWIVMPNDGAEEKLNVMLGSGERIDAICLNIGDAEKLISRGGNLAMPLNDLLAEYGQDLLKNIPEEAWIPCTNAKGEIVFLPDYYQWRWQGCAIRTDLLKEQGLEMPTTIAELENVMEVFKNAYPDMMPATGLPWFMEPFLQGAVSGVASSQPDENWVLTEEGTVVPAMILPEYKNMLALYQRWIDNGWFDPEFLAGSDDSQTLLWTSGRVGIWFCDPHRALDWSADALRLNFPDATADFMPVPKDENGVASFPVSYGVGRVMFIHSGSKIAPQIIQFMNKQVSDIDFYRLCGLGIEGEHWIDLGDEWSYPEGVTVENAPYSEVYRPLAWEFYDILKPRVQSNPLSAEIHNRLNASYAENESILTGLEGFKVDSSRMSMYTPIDLYENMMNIAAGVAPLDDFDSIVEQWYATGGKELSEEYTRQYHEWAEANAE